MSSQATENYSSIYKLEQRSSGVTPSALAAALRVSAASVSNMLKKLDDKGWSAIRLTGGRPHRPRPAESLAGDSQSSCPGDVFEQVLGLSWDEVDQEAEVLEHWSVKRSSKPWTRTDHPRFDPHGSPIPDAHGKIPWNRRHGLWINSRPRRQRKWCASATLLRRAALSVQLEIIRGRTLKYWSAHLRRTPHAFDQRHRARHWAGFSGKNLGEPVKAARTRHETISRQGVSIEDALKAVLELETEAQAVALRFGANSRGGTAVDHHPAQTHARHESGGLHALPRLRLNPRATIA